MHARKKTIEVKVELNATGEKRKVGRFMLQNGLHGVFMDAFKFRLPKMVFPIDRRIHCIAELTVIATC